MFIEAVYGIISKSPDKSVSIKEIEFNIPNKNYINPEVYIYK